MNTKWPVYPAVIAASLSGLVVLSLGWLSQFSISIEPTEPETSSLPESVAPTPQSPPSDRLKSSMPSHYTPASKPLAWGPGTLRISNQSDLAVRVALLAQKSLPTSVSSKQSPYGVPAHWDFAPGEGSSQGLIVSLPEGNLKLKKGDILVAFAQDGSGRYWGPYVVGETATPIWDRKAAEWQLILQP